MYEYFCSNCDARINYQEKVDSIGDHGLVLLVGIYLRMMMSMMVIHMRGLRCFVIGVMPFLIDKLDFQTV